MTEVKWWLELVSFAIIVGGLLFITIRYAIPAMRLDHCRARIRQLEPEVLRPVSAAVDFGVRRAEKAWYRDHPEDRPKPKLPKPPAGIDELHTALQPPRTCQSCGNKFAWVPGSSPVSLCRACDRLRLNRDWLNRDLSEAVSVEAEKIIARAVDLTPISRQFSPGGHIKLPKVGDCADCDWNGIIDRRLCDRFTTTNWALTKPCPKHAQWRGYGYSEQSHD